MKRHRCLDGRSCLACAGFPGHRRARYLVQARDERRILRAETLDYVP